MQEIDSPRGPEMKIENFINCPGLGNLGVGMSVNLQKFELLKPTPDRGQVYYSFNTIGNNLFTLLVEFKNI